MLELDIMYRIMVLYMLNIVEYPLTNTQITNFVLENDYTNYFTIQEAITALSDAQLIVAQSTHNNTRYHLTEEGRQTLTFFQDKISDAIKEDIRHYCQTHDFDLRQETFIYADYYKTTDHRYAVRCRIQEEHTDIVDLTLHVQNRMQAEAVCRNWKKSNLDVYEILMDTLIK